MQSKQPAFEIAICCVAILAFAVWLGNYINLDFWNDELITLTYFVFVPFQKIVTDYSVANNHIFFNILNHLYVGVLPIANLPALMDHPFWIRSLMAFYTAVTLVYLYRIGNRFFNRTVATAAIIILLTTVPFYNFAVQVRGYSLSMALAAMLVFYTWSFTASPNWKNALMLLASSVLLLYTLPTNLYFVGAVLLLNGGFGLVELVQAVKRGSLPDRPTSIARIWVQIRSNAKLKCAVLLLLSGVPGFGLYLPVLPELVRQSDGIAHPLTNLAMLARLVPTTMKYFLSLRFALIPLCAVGLGVIFWRMKRPAPGQSLFYTTSCLFLLIVPYLLSAIWGDTPFDRSFIYLAVIFALLAAATGYEFIRLLRLPEIKNQIFLLALLAYCQVSFSLALNQRDQHIRQDIEAGVMSQDIFINYYQAFYAPLKTALSIANQRNLFPVNIYQPGDAVSLIGYLEKYNIPYTGIHSTQDMVLTADRSGLFVTAMPQQLVGMLEKDAPYLTCNRQNQQNFFAVFYCHARQ